MRTLNQTIGQVQEMRVNVELDPCKCIQKCLVQVQNTFKHPNAMYRFKKKMQEIHEKFDVNEYSNYMISMSGYSRAAVNSA
jgi:hypothetical protein